MTMRLDVYLTEKGICRSRSAAQQLIDLGGVSVNGKTAAKNSLEIDDTDEVEIVELKLPKYVGRGGQKLEGALGLWSVDLNGKTCLDIGASTGGFTDCMLQNGAARVFAVDVGSGQLAEKLRADDRVISLEQTDIRDFTFDNYDISAAEFIGTDVSFISLKLVLPHIYRLLAEGGTAVALIKPQFEAGRGSLSKKGIVRDEKTRLRCVEEVKQFAEQCGFAVIGTAVSPITGGDGNVEYLLGLKKSGGERQ
ncbi:MAG: TlyA family RNA methyltransferase [Ruminococcaceae bacterium]|nr:TlyA family RNA methyltransferase [Oscillospiraceae bacterium]